MAFVDHKITFRKVKGFMVQMAMTPWIPDVFTIFRKKSSLSSFLPCSSTYSQCSFVICLTLALAWFLISALSLRYFSTSCNTLWNSMGEISPSCIACEMILAVLSNLIWASSLMALCFSCFIEKVLQDFHVMTVARERSKGNANRQANTTGKRFNRNSSSDHCWYN